MIDRSLNYGRHLIEKFVASVGPVSAVADLGAGTGVDLALAKKHHPSAHFHAIEVYPPYAKNLTSAGYTVHSLNIERDVFPFGPESLDIVMANQILEHVKEIFWIFDQVARSLKVGGHFIVGVPNLASLHNRLLLAIGRQPTAIHVPSAHLRGYTKAGFEALLKEAGLGVFEIKDWGGSNFYPFPPFLAKPLASLFPNMAWGLFLLLKKTRPYKGEFLEFIAPGKHETNYYNGQ